MAKKRYQYEQKESNAGKIALGVVASLLLLGCGGAIGYIINDSINENQMQQSSDFTDGVGSSIIEQEGLQVKRLSSVTNDDGSVTQTFSFAITPENASNQNVTASAKYKDGTDCSAAVTVSVDNTAKTISVTCKADFGQQIIVTVVASADSSKTATIAVDYEKKLNGVNALVTNSDVIGLGEGPSYKTAITFDDLFEVDYSLYTIDKEYTYSFELTSLSIKEVKSPGTSHTYKSQMNVLTGSTGLMSLMKGSLDMEGGLTMPSASEIWNLSTSNEYHSLLKDIGAQSNDDDTNYISFSSVFRVQCNETEENFTARPIIKISLENDYSAFSVNVDFLAVETPSIVF